MKRFAFSLLFFAVSVLTTAYAQIPPANQKIIQYLNTVIGTKVGRGECWDLAHDALEGIGAQWDHEYQYGREVDPEKDSIYPGDIIQFSNVIIKAKTDKGLLTETYPKHTAIVYEVLGKGQYRIAHQNNGYSGRKVGLSILILANKKSGKIKFYRPVI